MRTILILQNPDIMSLLSDYLRSLDDCLVVNTTRLPVPAEKKSLTVLNQRELSEEFYAELALTAEDRVLFDGTGTDGGRQQLKVLCSQYAEVPILVLTSAGTGGAEGKDYDTVSYLPLSRIIDADISRCWQKIENRKKATALQQLASGHEHILILTQHDPDPDALASALALRTLLGRTSVTAPIATFGEVTRNENQVMMQLLDIQLLKVTAADLQKYSRIAMVDVQPFYFGDPEIRADIIIDHHPQMEDYDALFCDIRAHYGATATIMAEYLIARDLKISQRLATALVYGIKTDTLFLGRDINPADIDIFTHIYPLANRHMILQMEHPRLKPEEISLIIKALKNQTLIGNAVFVGLGRVNRDEEDIIPRLADFCMQIDNAQWSVVSGIVEKQVVLCVRNVGYVEHAGEVVRHAFGKYGSAGGHRSMARAVFPLSVFKKQLKISRRGEVDKKLINLFLNARDGS
jgi:nanoRNase/pAp phosphatase (c-di-AMP/oligoRNAs hydrolase)